MQLGKKVAIFHWEWGRNLTHRYGRYSPVTKYGKCSKVLNANCLPKSHRQTAQTQLRLLLQKQSDQDLPCLLFRHAFWDLRPNTKQNYLKRV